MRALILSDIHSNLDALEAVLAAAPAYDVVWNLGDVVGYNAAPIEVIERVRGLGTVFVRGNHDRACSGLDDAKNFNPIAWAAVQWTKARLDDGSAGWLRNLPCGPIWIRAGDSRSNDEGPATSASADRQRIRQTACVHGSLRDEDEYLLTVEEAAAQPMGTGNPAAFFGHTHVQGGFAGLPIGDWIVVKPVYTNREQAESYTLDLRDSLKYLINPGSVGQPRDGDWRAAFAVYDDTAQRVTFFRVPYDVRLAQMRITRAGLPDALARRLGLGR
jgi:predicted phosphodiesterase